MKNKNFHLMASGPSITKVEKRIVYQMMNSGWNNYQYVEKFEKDFARFHKRQYCLLMPSCTLSIYLILKSLKIKKGDEIICPDTTWTATAAPIIELGAIPVFIDVKEDSWCINEDLIEQKISKKTRAIIFVDLFGNLPDIEKLNKISKKYKIPLIEDSAEALGSKYNGLYAGKFGLASVHSFHRTKTITSGEGGAILTDNKSLFKKMKAYRDLGRSKINPYIADNVSLKFMPSNFQASILCGQLSRIKQLLKIKKKLHYRYIEQLKKNKIFFTTNVNNKKTQNGFWATSIVYDSKYKITSAELINKLYKKKIAVRHFFSPLSTQPGYKKVKIKRTSPRVGIELYSRGLTLPSHYLLTKNNIDFICSNLSSILKKHESNKR